ncbi:MAG: hypothetical protein A3D31_08320 [Candidatus Fluviicola riflensis]|nr:MAG: hypothetical protein CHH17_06680 [Candidatus Fluviicola riflensis]OGS79944.1 MAG: hypothetical protein A3D31_08320 [Candidatus Fluviicola riflensis]OGS82459.1 MAG: hypothetical protein A2724_17265 [Fluviicola sp. RIFCSPHIGHO2_01_FULL_43_53]OGS88123.1 MAG: hypothetical protein A3E30_14700 [Fluviicola sp. RIFCSPHIGHO2_12_FULL_43_24]
METENTSQWLMGDDMPHREFMEDNGLVPTDFSESLREKLSLFDVEFAKALNDGIVTDDEYTSLHSFSTELESLIRKEWDSKKNSSQTGAVVAILIAIGAIIGLGKLSQ